MTHVDDELLCVRTVPRIGDVVIVALAGELDISTAPKLRAEIDRLVAAGIHRIVIEAGELKFMDSSGLSSLLVSHRALQARGGCLEVHAPSPAVLRVLEISGVSHFIAVSNREWEPDDDPFDLGDTPPAA